MTEDIKNRRGKDWRVRQRRKLDEHGNVVGAEQHITDRTTCVRLVVLNTRPYQSSVSYGVNSGRYNSQAVKA